jgi:putative endonuclease
VTSTTARGAEGERSALEFLGRQGYRIVECNYRCRRGEIDIVAEEGVVLCFVEVRTRRDDAFGGPLPTVHGRKQSRIIAAARHYLAVRRVTGREVRFDVVGITYQPTLSIELVRGAFESRSYW